MKNIVIGLLLSLALITPAIAEKTEVETDHCITRTEVISNVVYNIPDATYQTIRDMIVFSSPSHADNLVTYFDDKDCYYAYDITVFNAS